MSSWELYDEMIWMDQYLDERRAFFLACLIGSKLL